MELNEVIAGNRAIGTDLTLLELIRLGWHLESISQDLFNPAIGNLLKIWG